VVCCCATLASQAPNNAADVQRLVEILEVREGSVVADIGAGSGQLSIAMARRVGGAGQVYSTDINPDRLRDIRGAVARARVENVTVVEGAASETNLPDACCDAIFMRDVYHHFAQPPEINASLHRSLKPGGRIAIVDFAPRSGRRVPPGARDQGADHGVLPADVVDELNASGFEGVEQVDWPSRGYFAVAGRRPR
jgi:ubiquinone/menaquinone biosynthesis C-methylase UbiE